MTRLAFLTLDGTRVRRAVETGDSWRRLDLDLGAIGRSAVLLSAA